MGSLSKVLALRSRLRPRNQRDSDLVTRATYPAAFRWFRKAAEQESDEREVAEAQMMLGEMFYLGEGTTQDFSEAFLWSRKAANRGIAGAQTWLATMYFRGHGVLKDASEAVRWYRKAAEQGTDQAQAMMGLLYSQGRGVPQDDVLAHMWLNLAASQGGENQKDRAVARDQLAQKMTREQLAEAQRMAREWRPLKAQVPQ